MTHTLKNREKIQERRFTRIAKYYDILNRLLSFGQDIRWRRKALKEIKVDDSSNVLDLCCGTGDMALVLWKKYNKCFEGTITGVDISDEMLRIARHKLSETGAQRDIILVNADVFLLPFENECFDIVTLAFGLRNLGDVRRSIKEGMRVLKSGGTILIIEFGKPQNFIIYPFWWIYISGIIPFIGWLFCRYSEYAYLSSSIRNFLSTEEILQILKESGLKNINYRPLMFGAVNCYYGQKG